MAAGAVEVNITTNNSRGCAMFDGVDDYVEVAHNANQLGANLASGFTISAWIMPRTRGETDGRIIDKSTGTTGQDGFFIAFGNNDVLYSRINSGTAILTPNSSISFNVWQHILITVSSNGTISSYIDGAISGTPTISAALNTITTTNAPRIGNRAGATDRTWDGSISKVKMWNKVLSADEIALDYAGSPVADMIIDVPLQYDYTDNKGNATTNSGSYLSIVDDTIAAEIKADRTTANDKYLMVGMPGGQVVSAVIEEAP